jgi:hypothetical protein
VNGYSVLVTMGRNDDLCPRTKSELSHARAIQLYLRGRAEIESGGRDLIARAASMGLPPTFDAQAKKDLDATEPAAEGPADPASATPRRTVVVFLPDVPAESEKKLAETMNALVAQWSAAANIPLQAELFRRADDARNFVLSNRDKVGVVIANPDFARAVDFTPKFAFTRDGSTSYRRVVVVPAQSRAKSLADLKGKSISAAQGLGDAGVAVTTRVPDDLAAAANVLYGKSDAALVHEANPLLVQRARDLHVIHTASAAMPVYAFGTMPPADRTALYESIHGVAALQMGVARIDRPSASRRELPPINLAPPRIDPPANVALRMTIELPQVTINEDLFGKP